MVKCSLCDAVYKDGRGLRGHIMKAHAKEFYECGKIDSCFRIEVDAEGNAVGAPQPIGLRYLNFNDEREFDAMGRGYLFIDNVYNCYTLEEYRGNKWKI